jgi:hypothetical protein
MKDAAKRLLAAARKLYRAYPARLNALIAGAVVAGLGAIGVAVDLTTVLPIVALEVPILLSGEATHRRVRPVR